MTTKAGRGIDSLRALMVAGAWREAVLMAASFPRLPKKSRDRILSAREAYLRPAFQLQLKHSLEQLIAAGREALVEAYGKETINNTSIIV